MVDQAERSSLWWSPVLWSQRVPVLPLESGRRFCGQDSREMSETTGGKQGERCFTTGECMNSIALHRIDCLVPDQFGLSCLKMAWHWPQELAIQNKLIWDQAIQFQSNMTCHVTQCDRQWKDRDSSLSLNAANTSGHMAIYLNVGE